jgi:alkanesulfonate monooxygenase SsuD/methylene tetrahydromethanopterin reductase-like flavin-dependent oxidoreductase (luciferase family)
VAETAAQARAEAEPHLDYFWQRLLSYHRGAAKLLGEGAPGSPASTNTDLTPLFELTFDETQQDGMTFVGDPDSVADAIEEQMEAVGAGVLMGLFQFGSLPHDLAKKNIELFAKKVLPRLTSD